VSAGLITPVDAVAFGLYCQTLHQYCEVLKAIPHVAEYTTEVGEQHSLVQHPLVGVLHKARADVLKLAREFGMTPSARAGLRLGTGEAKEVDPLDAILARRKK
jgi:P27 family predicted phage terminase small subunit